MKKLIAFVIAFSFLLSFAFADSAMSIMAMFNYNAGVYGAKPLDESMITEETSQRIVFSAGDATISFASTNSESFNSALVISSESEFLPYCICATMCINPVLDNSLESFGNVLYGYLTVRGGKESAFGFFGGLLFNIKKDGDNYRFLIGEM